MTSEHLAIAMIDRVVVRQDLHIRAPNLEDNPSGYSPSSRELGVCGCTITCLVTWA